VHAALRERGVATQAAGEDPEDVDPGRGLLREVPEGRTSAAFTGYWRLGAAEGSRATSATGARWPTVGGVAPGPPARKELPVLRVLLTLVFMLFAAWVVLGVLGWVVKGLFWLAVVGIVVLVGSALLGRTGSRR
jgi:hypothetical protein